MLSQLLLPLSQASSPQLIAAALKREQKKVINELTGHLDALEQQVIDLQDCSRRNNLRLLGLPEGTEKDDPIGFLKRSLPRWLPSLSGTFLQYPATLKIVMKHGETKLMHSPDEAHRFLSSIPATHSPEMDVA
ncbi:hypothetical protein QQF64_017344 [Cirrhinus molitorella]|uniref:Uncharacterized protein n=1 Tax=Cirrhinus molitorella TaxID=172907 RepID=A0ABR3LIE2_9TELE